MSSTIDDHLAIQTTVANLAHFTDHKQWHELRGLFADTVRTDYTSLFGGGVQRQSGNVLIDGWRTRLTPIITQHFLGPITVDVSGSTATARCHVRGYHHAEGTAGGDEWMVAGHYVVELRKSESLWRIDAMTLQMLYQTGNARLLEAAGGE